MFYRAWIQLLIALLMNNCLLLLSKILYKLFYFGALSLFSQGLLQNFFFPNTEIEATCHQCIQKAFFGVSVKHQAPCQTLEKQQ